MAQHILDRVAASLRPSSRLVDCRKALADGETELAELDGRIAEAERHSTNPSVDDEDARAAWERAEDFRLLKRRLSRGLDELREVIDRKEEAARSEERVSAYADAKAARDSLVERWKVFEEVYGQFIQLLADTHENDHLLAKIHRMLPEGAARLRSAELEARGPINEVRWANGEPFRRFVTLDWDNFSRSGFAWSPREAERRTIVDAVQREGARLAAAMSAHAAANTPQAIAEREAREAARYRRYEVRPQRYSGGGRIPIRHRSGTAGIGAELANLWLDEQQVEAAKAAGLVVQLVEDDELVR